VITDATSTLKVDPAGFRRLQPREQPDASRQTRFSPSRQDQRADAAAAGQARSMPSGGYRFADDPRLGAPLSLLVLLLGTALIAAV